MKGKGGAKGSKGGKGGLDGGTVRAPLHESHIQLSDADRQMINALFRQLDQDKSGVITKLELSHACVTGNVLYSGLGLTDRSRDMKQTISFFEAIDVDGSGQVSLSTLSLSTLPLAPLSLSACSN